MLKLQLDLRHISTLAVHLGAEEDTSQQVWQGMVSHCDRQGSLPAVLVVQSLYSLVAAAASPQRSECSVHTARGAHSVSGQQLRTHKASVEVGAGRRCAVAGHTGLMAEWLVDTTSASAQREGCHMRSACHT